MQRVLAVLLFLAIFLAASLPSTAQSACLNNAQAQSAVAGGEASPLRSIWGNISRSVSGNLIGSKLCRDGGRLVYIITVRDGGQVRTVTADARSGAVISVR